MKSLDMAALPLEGDDGLLDVLRNICDPRKARGKRYTVLGLLAISVCAVLSGLKSIEAIAEYAAELPAELRKRLGCKRGRAPSESTFRRIFRQVNAEEIDLKVGEWVIRRAGTLAGQTIAIDGKTLRGARLKDTKAPHLLSAIIHASGTVIAQTSVSDDKTNEIKRVQPLFEKVDLTGAIITGDALLTQKEIATHLVEDKEADYVFTVKDNQPTLRQDIADLNLDTAFPPSAPNDR